MFCNNTLSAVLLLTASNPDMFLTRLLAVLAVTTAFWVTEPLKPQNCVNDKKIFDFQVGTTTQLILPYPSEMPDCAIEVLKTIWTEEATTVKITSIEEEKVIFSDHLVKISQHLTIFLFREGDEVQKFINEYWVLAHSSSIVLLITIDDCDNFEILSVWWLHYKILNVFGYCSTTNHLFLYNPLKASISEWNLNNVSNPNSLLIKTKNLHGHPLKIYMFDRIPTAVSAENISEPISESRTYKELMKLIPYAGTDGFMLAELARLLNFTPFVVAPKERLAYGQIFENGSGFGLLGSVATREADLAGNGLYMKDYHTDKLDFLFSYTGINMCFIVPKATAIPQWKLVFSCFTVISWGSLFSILVLLTLIWNLFEIVLPEGQRYGAFYMFQLFLSVASRDAPVVDSKRLLILTCLFFSIVITSVFQGNLVTSYTKTVFYKDLETLEDIDESGLLVSTCIADIFGHNITDVQKRLESKRVKTMMERSINRVAYTRDCCALERKKDAEFNIESIYISDDGTPLLHITSACDLSYPVALAVLKGFSFADSFNDAIARFVEGGFIDKWNEDVTHSITVHNRMRRSNRGGATNKIIGMREMQAAFYILNVGLILSFLVFLSEILVKKKVWFSQVS